MQRLYETKLTEMAQEWEAARPTKHAKALQDETHPEEPKNRYSDGTEKLRQEVTKMGQEKKDMQRKFEEFLREVAQEKNDTASSTATVHATGDTCWRTHG